MTTIAVARYLPNGNLDASFGNGGTAILTFDNGGESRTMAVRVAASDNVIVCCNVANRVGVARLLTNGDPDKALGSNGRVVVPFMEGLDSPAVTNALFAQSQPVFAPAGPALPIAAPGAALPFSLHIIVAGRVGGRADQQLAAVARYSAQGQPDRTFSSDGRALMGLSTNRFQVQTAAFSARQNRICIVAEDRSGGPLPRLHLACLSANGSPDASFGNGGHTSVVFVAPEGGSSQVVAGGAVVQPDAITIAGSASNSDKATFALARVRQNGGVDRNFGHEGLAFARFEASDSFARSVMIDARGRVVAAGRANRSFALARFMQNGGLDLQFGQGGHATTRFEDGRSNVNVVKLVSAGSERILAAGDAGQHFALARYLENGSLDPEFGVSGKVRTVFPGENLVSRIYDIAFDSQARIVAAGILSPILA